MRKTVVMLLLIVAALSLLSLVSGAPYLETLLPGGLPLGNALTALGLCASAGSAIGLSVRGTALRMVSIASLIGAAAWLPVSIVLAGNLTLNFHGGRGDTWLVLSAVITATVLCAVVWALAVTLLSKFRNQPGMR